MLRYIFNTLLESVVFVGYVGIVFIQIAYIIMMWTYWSLRFPFKWAYLKITDKKQQGYELKKIFSQHIALPLLYCTTLYWAYFSMNAHLHGLRDLGKGVLILVILPTVILGCITYLSKPKFKELILTSFFFIMAFRKVWDNPFYDFLQYGQGAVIALKILMAFVIIALCYVITRWKPKQLMKISVIFSIAFIAGYMPKFFNQMETKWQILNVDGNKAFFSKKLGKEFIYNKNVYHIVVDSYPNLKTYKKVYNYDNTAIYKTLESKGFKTYPNAFSNGNATTVAMGVIFNMAFDKLIFSTKYHREKPFHLYGKNPAWGTMIQQEYNIFCEYPCMRSDAPAKVSESIIFPYEISDMPFIPYQLIQYYLEYYLKGFHFYKGIKNPNTPILSTDNTVIPRGDIFMYYHALKVLPDKKPFVMYIHDLSSHLNNTKAVPQKNKQILKVVDHINKNDPDSIVIIHSDHGNRYNWAANRKKADDTAQQNFGIFMAVKFPDSCQRFNTKKLLSPVNIYRYIHACLRGEGSVKNIQPANSYMNGKTMKTIWDSDVHKDLNIFIENNKILASPKKVK